MSINTVSNVWYSINLRKISLLGTFVACLPAMGQPTNRLTLKQPVQLNQLVEDFDTFQLIYQAANSGLYKYHSKNSIDSAFAANRRQIGHQTTLLDLYRLIYAVTDYTGSLHSDNYLPAAVDSLLKSQTSFFPYPTKLVDQALLINTVHAPCPVGSRILTINGRQAGKICHQLGKYATTDGYNKTGKEFLISQHFSWFYRLEYGFQSTYELTYLAPNQADTSQITLPAVSYATGQQAFAQRRSLPLESHLPAYDLKLHPETATALLTVRTFALEDEQQRSYSRFLDSTFRRLKRQRSIKHLIVDVRLNGGGDDPNDLLLYSYLTKRHFREHKRAYTIFRQMPYAAYFVEDTPGERQALEAELRAEHRSRAHRGKYYLRSKENPRWRPARDRFRGTIYLLIGPEVASAGSLFASLVRHDRNSVVIGEETMGGYYGHTGHTPVEYCLPNTQIRLKFSIIDLEQDVRPLPFIAKGRGVIPDYVVKESLESFLDNRDPVLSFTRQLIQSADTKTPKITK